MTHQAPPPSVRLRTLAGRARNHPRDTLAGLYGLGKILLEAKGLRPKGGFRPWTLRAAGLAPDTVKRAMLAARRIKAPVELMRGVAASAVRALASKRVAKSARLTEKALAAEPGPTGRIGYRAVQSAISTLDPAAVHDLAAAAESPREALGRRVERWAETPTVDSVLLVFDRHAAEDLPQVSVTVLGDERSSVSRGSVHAAAAAACGEEAGASCPKCKRVLSASAFSKKSHYCKRCERERVSAYSKKKRVEKAATRQRIEEMG